MIRTTQLYVVGIRPHSVSSTDFVQTYCARQVGEQKKLACVQLDCGALLTQSRSVSCRDGGIWTSTT